MQIRDLLLVLWRRRLVLVAILAIVVAAAAFMVSREDKVYESRATIALLPDADNETLVPFYGQAVQNLLPTYAQLVESESFLEPVAARLPFEIDAAGLKGAIFADPASNVGVLSVVAHDGDPEDAQLMAQAVAEEFVAALDNNGIVELMLINDARVAESPVSPKPRLVISAALVVGLMLGAAGAFGWDQLFARISTAHHLSEATSVPVLGVLPKERKLQDARRVVVGEPGLEEFEEALRAVRTNLLFASKTSTDGPIMISSVNVGDGKSTVAANLAAIIGELGFSVLLIDADVHRPVQHTLFGVPNDRGLTTAGTGSFDPASLVVPTGYPKVGIVPAGPPLRSRTDELNVYLRQLPKFRGLADIVLVDTPPLRAADDVRLLAAFSGAVVLTLRAGSATARQVGSAMSSLHVLGAPVLGTILTMATERRGEGLAPEYYRYREPPVPD